VNGELHGKGTVNEPIRIKEGCTIQREVGEGGKPSVTHWESLATDSKISVLSIILETGRTHQIRVHMSWLGYPLVGDTMYSEDDSFPRHALHCADMTFDHPMTGETLSLHAPIPDDMCGLIASHGLEVTL